MALTKPRFGQIDTSITAFNDAVTILNAASDNANVDVGFIINRSFDTLPNVAIYWSEAGNAFTTSWTTASGYTAGNITSIGLANLATGHMTVTGHILPTTSELYDLGSPTKRFRTLYVSGNTIDLGGATISANADAISFSTTGGATFTVQSQVGGSQGSFDSLLVTSDTISTSTTTGALIVTGGMGVSGNINAQILGAQDFRYANGATISSTVGPLVDQAIAISPAISSINANVTAANAAIVTANTAMKGYVDTSITAANVAQASYVDLRINELIGGAPGTLDTLAEIAANLANEADAIGSIINSITSTNANVTAANAKIDTLTQNIGTINANLGTATNNITTLFSNAAAQADQITGANAAIVTANTAMKGYVDGQITTVNGNITTANTALKSYVDGQISTVSGAITTANTGMKSYVDSQVTTANTALKSYVDNRDTIISTSLINANTDMKAYVDGRISVTNNNITTANTEMKGYVDGQIASVSNAVTTANTNLKNYVDGRDAVLTSNAAIQAQAIAVLDANLGTATTNISTLFSNATAQSQSIDTINANLGTATNNINTLFANAGSQASSINTINANLGTATTNITTLFSNAGSQASSINTINANLGTATTNITTLFSNAASQAQTLTDLSANLGTATTNITTLFSNAAGQANQITGANAAIVTANTGMKSYVDSQISTVSGAITTANTGMKSYVDSQISTVSASVTTANTNLKNYVDDRDAVLTSNAATQSQAIASINANLGTATTNINTLFSNAASQAQNINTIDANLGVATNNINTLFSSANAQSESLSTIDANLGTATTNINTLFANAGAQATALNTINANLGTATNNITTLFSNAATQATALNTINANLGTATNNITTLFSNAATQANQITGANTAIVTANTGMKSYVDGQISTTSSAIVTANTNMKSYVDGQITSVNNNITSANNAVVSYVNTLNSAMAANVAAANTAITNNAYSDTKVANYLPTHTGTIGGTLTTATQANITIVGNLTTLTVAGNAVVGQNLRIDGNLDVAGTLTTFNSNTLVLEDSIIYLAEDNTSDVLDAGIVSSFTNATYQHTGFVRDATDGVWKLFANVVTEPTTTVDFTNATYSSIRVGPLTASSAVVNGTIVASTLNAATIGNAGAAITGTIQTASQTNITGLGTITTGVWSATDVGLAHGGTNASLTAVNGGIVYSTASAMAIGSAGTSGQLLTSGGAGAPTWTTPSTLAVNTANHASAANVAVYESVTASTTNATFYPMLSGITTGNTAGFTASTLTHNPSTGNLTATGLVGTHYGSGAGLTSIPNSALTNSSVTVTAGSGLSGGGTVSLGGSITLTNAGVTSLVAGTNISVSGATGAVTVNVTGTIETANVSLYQNVTATTTSATFYPMLSSLTGGNTAGFTASTLTHNPSTGNLNATGFVGAHYGSGAGLTSIPNSALTNSSVTVNGTAISLGGTGTVTANTPNSVTFNNAGSGGASGSTFNGGSALTVSYNTVGASPLAGSTSIITLGTVTTGTWSATDVGLAHGGTNASLTAVNGGIVYSTASAMAIGSAGTSGQLLTSGGAGAPTWTTPSTLAVSTANYANAANVSLYENVTQSTNNATFYPVLSGLLTGNTAGFTASTLSHNPSTGVLSATQFSGSGAGLTNIPNSALTNSSITINGSAVSLGGSITIATGLSNALTFNNSGSGAASGSTFDGNSAVTVSYNTVGASPLAGSASLTTVGTITTGTWSATDVGLAHGGTNASLTAVNGGIVYSTASAMAITSAGTSGQVLTSGGAGAPTWANQNTLAVNTANYASAANVSLYESVTASTTNATFYPMLSGITTGNTAGFTASTLTHNPSTGNLTATGLVGTHYGSGSGLTGIPNSALTNSSVTINGTAVSLGGSATITASNPNTLTLGTYLTGGSYNGSAAVTAAVDATSTNTASKVVARDASGNFAAGTITATLSGTATTATNLAGGSAGTIPYQTGAGATAMLAAGTSGYLLKSNGTSAPSWIEASLTDLPDAWTKKAVRAATTANIALSGTQTIDGVVLVANDRVLVKDQTTASENGIYIVAAGAWSRSTDADTINKIAGACVNVDSGTANGGFRFDNDIKTTDTLGTTSIVWNRIVDTGLAVTSGSALTDAYVRYSGTTNTAGQFNGGTTTPNGSTRLNYSGYFYPTFINLVGSGDTATAATHYFVETGSDGFVRPKTLTNVRTEIVTTAAVNSAAATTVGTVTTGTWNATAITDTYLATISTAGKVLNSATTATSVNTASAIVARDGSGNFAAGAITVGNVITTNGVFWSNGSAYSSGGGIKWTASATAPASPNAGDFWYDTDDDVIYQYVSDGVTPAWVDQSAPTSYSTITVNNILNGGSGGTGNIGTAATPFNRVFARATTAEYADLAENYQADAVYSPGTVVVFGGAAEVTVSDTSHDTRVAGVISTQPSYLMNSGLQGETVAAVALTGRVPCWVQGPVNKGDRLVNISSGVAGVLDKQLYEPGCIIGKSLEAIADNSIKLIEVVIGRF